MMIVPFLQFVDGKHMSCARLASHVTEEIRMMQHCRRCYNICCQTYAAHVTWVVRPHYKYWV